MNRDSEVIIVGAGPVGLGAALELARFGVRSILVEKHASTSHHPKTRNFNTRTMEIARGWGSAVYNRLRSIDTPPGWKSPIRFLESAVGSEFGSIQSLGFEGPGPDVSPALPIMSSQELIEQIMLDAVRATDMVDVRFSTEALRLVRGGSDGDTAAAVEIKDLASGRIETIKAAALVAADGVDSLIRSELGLELMGAKNLYHFVNCYFRADIESHLADRNGVLLFVNNAAATGVLQPLDARGRWLCQITVPPEDWNDLAFTKERAADWVRAAAGVPDLEVDILSLGFWRLNATVAEKLVQGRVMLCGDAAHQFPPTGGLGVNTGLQGMHNAMWKLALFIKGEAGWGLVETYNSERRPVSEAIVMQSLVNSANVQRINMAAASGGESGLSTEEVVQASRRYGNHLGVEFGAHYASRAVIADGSAPPEVADSYSDYAPSAVPGCRLPHVWLGEGAAQQSSHDLLGPHFTLLAGPEGDQWQTTGGGIACHKVDAAATARYAIGPDGALLVRPDGHVAWRASSFAEHPNLAKALAQILA